MKLKISIHFGYKDPRTGKAKSIQRDCDVTFNSMQKAVIVKIPIDARGNKFVDVKIERPEV